MSKWRELALLIFIALLAVGVYWGCLAGGLKAITEGTI